jgi:hypothetical protein
MTSPAEFSLTSTGVLTDLPVLDGLLAPHREGLGKSYWGYRAHCYRMVNWARSFTDPEPYREDKLAIVTVLHDLPFFLSGDLDYLGKACELTTAHLKQIGREEWTEELHLMINNHHKVRSYVGPFAPMVEAVRRADWIDVSFTKLRYGLPREFVAEVRATFPMNEAYKGIAMPAIAKYAAGHLGRPLPMMRW